MDIIKLYGSGVEKFVPDPKMGHDFYRVANAVIARPNTTLRLTVKEDDICKPCKMMRHQACADALPQFPQFQGKEEYNRLLDTRILDLFGLEKPEYAALELCGILYASHRLIFKVWREERDEAAAKRHALFCMGAEKYIRENGGESPWPPSEPLKSRSKEN